MPMERCTDIDEGTSSREPSRILFLDFLPAARMLTILLPSNWMLYGW
jgi:hypothetical protein